VVPLLDTPILGDNLRLRERVSKGARGSSFHAGSSAWPSGRSRRRSPCLQKPKAGVGLAPSGFNTLCRSVTVGTVGVPRLVPFLSDHGVSPGGDIVRGLIATHAIVARIECVAKNAHRKCNGVDCPESGSRSSTQSQNAAWRRREDAFQIEIRRRPSDIRRHGCE
jgi:hypothetical protein